MKPRLPLFQPLSLPHRRTVLLPCPSWHCQQEGDLFVFILQGQIILLHQDCSRVKLIQLWQPPCVAPQFFAWHHETSINLKWLEQPCVNLSKGEIAKKDLTCYKPSTGCRIRQVWHQGCAVKTLNLTSLAQFKGCFFKMFQSSGFVQINVPHIWTLWDWKPWPWVSLDFHMRFPAFLLLLLAWSTMRIFSDMIFPHFSFKF